ncbi:MAG: metallophosphoesterase [Propionibacteriaceae bacterium]
MSAPSVGSVLARAGSVAGAVALAGTAGVGYAWLEARSFRLRRVEVPVLPAGADRIRILHLSDLHLTPGQHRKRTWVSRLAGLEPDLVVDTGDNLAHVDAVGPVLETFGRLLDRPGVFVWGSNDYHGPSFKNPARYLRQPTDPTKSALPDLPWTDLRDGFEAHGWDDLTHHRVTREIAGLRIEFRGTDDAHLGRDDYAQVAGPPAEGVDLSIGVTHAPYRRILDAMTADEVDLILAGHTHGGQLCVPGYGALVTNCDLDTKRAKGLSTNETTDQTSWLHVSGGLGTSPYAPVRFACPPEATLLTLVPAP